MKIKTFLLTAAILPFAQACSFSTSSESISGSLSESSGSFSDSVVSVISSGSSSEKDTKDYQVQVMNYTNVYFTSAEFDSAAYNLGISELAEEAGISNWEDDADTLNGIGKGLKKANITGSLYEVYKSSISTKDATRMDLIQKGYDSQD
ncbi:MAG: putative lipoprotein [Methyloprofundus sp.]|nr:putative lipoprotein [Methyloprofundus sp.]